MNKPGVHRAHIDLEWNVSPLLIHFSQGKQSRDLLDWPSATKSGDCVMNWLTDGADVSVDFQRLVNIPVEGIRLSDAVYLLLGKRRRVPFAAVWSQPGVVCSEKVTFDPLTRWPVDLFKTEPLKGNSEVHLHTPTKFGEDPSKDLGGVGEQTNNVGLLYLHISPR